MGAVEVLKERFLIHDCGEPRLFEIAKDEVQFIARTRQQRPQRILAQASAEHVRQFVKGLPRNIGDEYRLVLYEVGQPRNEFTRRILTRQILAKLASGFDADAIARGVGAEFRGEVSFAPG